eukprot:TRINITY_DN80456_c0_g1_i1.p2 TRINITY_DN80456_c0_g1~~TRINITY_DN80456_c0_g1_i1.p2  ORF type:complete len:156 (-),score=29.04 TRINITY_DN80456_c0_g1_i1:37-504(-)
MQFLTEKEVEEVLEGGPSPFIALERWMECLGQPPRPCWIKIKGVPLHAWHEEVFKLLGGCFGRTVEVDEKTIKEEHFVEGRTKVLLDNTIQFPSSMPISVEEVKFSVHLEMEETKFPNLKGAKEDMRGDDKKIWSRCQYDEWDGRRRKMMSSARI